MTEQTHGNNIPVFFIQDAIKFPDLVHAVKPEPHNEIPQASSAYDTFWDFIALTPESMHMILWLMSDQAIPRSLSMIEGFSVYTFRFINADGLSRFVKFHWNPLLGVHGLVRDEAQQIAGVRRALADAGAQAKTIGLRLGEIAAADGQGVPIAHRIDTMPSVVFDAVLIPGGAPSVDSLIELEIVGRRLNSCFFRGVGLWIIAMHPVGAIAH
jgi:hypothetical protein